VRTGIFGKIPVLPVSEGTLGKAGLAKVPLWAKFIRDLPDPKDET
jgi:hypothetical protein